MCTMTRLTKTSLRASRLVNGLIAYATTGSHCVRKVLPTTCSNSPIDRSHPFAPHSMSAAPNDFSEINIQIIALFIYTTLQTAIAVNIFKRI